MITYAVILGQLGASRAAVCAGFRARGGDRDRWHTRDRRCMVEALVAEEDRLESEASRKAENMAARVSLKAVRRALETEVYT